MKMLEQWWKRRFLKEAVEGAGGGTGGGGGSGAGAGVGGGGEGGAGGGEDGDGKGAGEAGAAGGGAGGDGGTGDGGGAPAVSKETQEELDRLRKFHQSASVHVEVDPGTGEIRAKAQPPATAAKMPTAEELADAQRANDIAERSAALIEQNRDAEQKTIEKFKAKDPLFSQNILKAREKVMGLPAAQRTPMVWERAYSMAMGELSLTGAYEKHYREEGKREAAAEFQKQSDMMLPEGSGAGSGGSGSKKIDVSKITLTREQKDAAVKLIQGGFLNSLDEYKENMVREGLAEVV